MVIPREYVFDMFVSEDTIYCKQYSVDRVDLDNLFSFVYKVCEEPYLQSFQYNFLNRTLDCRYSRCSNGI